MATAPIGGQPAQLFGNLIFRSEARDESSRLALGVRRPLVGDKSRGTDFCHQPGPAVRANFGTYPIKCKFEVFWNTDVLELPRFAEPIATQG